jgi:hypothetical protein
MARSIKYYQFRLFLIRFFIIGMTSYIIEVFFTGTISFVGAIHDSFTIPNYALDLTQAAQGHVGIFAFFVYCWAAIPFTFLTNPLKHLIQDNLIIPKAGVVVRGIIYGLIFMAIEFVIGIFMLLVFHMRSWDYSNLPLNVFGVITFSYLPAWTLAGVIGEWFHDRLLQIDDIVLNPGLFYKEGIQKGYQKYTKNIELKKSLVKKARS